MKAAKMTNAPQPISKVDEILEALFDKHTIALTGCTTEMLGGAPVRVTSYDERVIDTVHLVPAIQRLILEAQRTELKKLSNRRSYTFQPVGGISNIKYVEVYEIEDAIAAIDNQLKGLEKGQV